MFQSKPLKKRLPKKKTKQVSHPMFQRKWSCFQRKRGDNTSPKKMGTPLLISAEKCQPEFSWGIHVLSWHVSFAACGAGRVVHKASPGVYK